MKVSPFNRKMIEEKRSYKKALAIHAEQKKRMEEMGYEYLPSNLIEEGATINISECNFEKEIPFGEGIYFRKKNK